MLTALCIKVRRIILNPSRFLLVTTLVVACQSVTPSVLARPKLDAITMKNGDRFTGEIKKLEFGQLHVKFSYSLGNAIFDWAEVEKIESPQGFVVETTDGSYHTGRLQKDADEEERTGIDLTVRGSSGTVRLQRDQVVVMRQLEEQFVKNMTVKVDYGFGYTRDNNRTNSS